MSSDYSREAERMELLEETEGHLGQGLWGSPLSPSSLLGVRRRNSGRPGAWAGSGHVVLLSSQRSQTDPVAVPCPPPDGTCCAEPHDRPARPAGLFQRGEWATPHLGHPRTWQKCHMCHALHSQTGGVAIHGPLSPCFPSLNAYVILPSNSSWDTRDRQSPVSLHVTPLGCPGPPWGAS